MTTDNLAGALTRAFQAEAGVTAAFLYGSHVEGRAHRESDIDVAVLLDRAVYPASADRFEVRVRLIGTLGSALRSNRVDLIVLNDVPATLARKVLRDGLSVYVHDAEALHTFSRTTDLMAPDLEMFLQRHRRRLLDTMTS
jgi:predicted nucleotidyltransferase